MTKPNSKQPRNLSALRAGLKPLTTSASSQLSMRLPGERLLRAAMLMMLLPLLSACPGPLPRPSEPLKFPTKPALTTPTPSQTYSANVAADLRKWEKQLTDTATTPKH